MYDDALLEELLKNQEAATARPADPESQVRRLRLLAAACVGAGAVLAAVVVGAVVWAVAGTVAGVVALVVVALALGAAGAWVVLRPRQDALAAAIGGRPADAVRDARLLNLVEGLCMVTGIRVPDVRVVEADGLNALAAGRSPASATLVVTTGLVAQLSRIELEGVLAAEIAAIRSERMVPATIAATLPALLARRAPQGPPAEIDLDRAAVALTRYPPGLIGGLQKMAEDGTAVSADPLLDDLWLAAPRGGAEGGRTPLAERIEALAEL